MPWRRRRGGGGKSHQATKTSVISEEVHKILVLLFQLQQENISMDFGNFKGNNPSQEDYREVQSVKILF